MTPRQACTKCTENLPTCPVACLHLGKAQEAGASCKAPQDSTRSPFNPHLRPGCQKRWNWVCGCVFKRFLLWDVVQASSMVFIGAGLCIKLASTSPLARRREYSRPAGWRIFLCHFVFERIIIAIKVGSGHFSSLVSLFSKTAAICTGFVQIDAAGTPRREGTN